MKIIRKVKGITEVNMKIEIELREVEWKEGVKEVSC